MMFFRRKPTPPPTTPNRQLFESALKTLGCEYEVEPDSKDYIASYQGEFFRVHVNDDAKFIHIYDLWWYDAPLDDIDQVAMIHRAVNEYNAMSLSTLVYSVNQEARKIGVHSRMAVFWSSEISGTAQYLRALFDDLLRSHQYFFREMEHLRQERFSKTQG